MERRSAEPLAGCTIRTAAAPAAPVRPASTPLPASEQDPAERSAKSIECAQKADARGLAGQTAQALLARVQARRMSAALRRPPLSEAPVRRAARNVPHPAGLAALCGRPLSLRRPRLRPRRDDGARRGRLSHPRGSGPADRHARSVSRRQAASPRADARSCDLIEARATTRKPAAYLVNRAYIQGVPFYVDERVIVPRSLIGELLMTAFAEETR